MPQNTMSAMPALCVWVTVISLALLALGCEESLSPDGGVEEPFTMYGVLSPQLDTQTVRLFLPENMPTLDDGKYLEVDVQSVDLETGERHRWMDSATTAIDGQPGRVFWSPLDVEFGRRYRIEAIRESDGARSFAEVRVPPRVTLRLDETDAPLLEVHIEGDAFRLLKPVAVYEVSRPRRHPDTGEFQPMLTYEVAYTGREKPSEQGWAVTFNMIVDATEVNYLYNGEICRGPGCGGECYAAEGRSNYVFLERLGIRALVANPQWDPPGGVFDPNVLAQPGVLSNVENGFGFVGAGYELNDTLHISQETVTSSCLRYY